MLIKNPAKHVLTDWYIADLLGLTKINSKTNEIVGIGIDGKCHVHSRLNKSIDMPVRRYSPTTRWADAGPAFDKFGYMFLYDDVVEFYNLPEAMRTIVSKQPKEIAPPPLVELLFGPDWQDNKDIL